MQTSAPDRASKLSPAKRLLLEQRLRGLFPVKTSLPAIIKCSRDQTLPLSFAQQRLWFLEQLQPENAVYNIPFGIRLQGDLDTHALQWSMREIIRRHEVLRTSFPSVKGVPQQEVHENFDPAFEFTDLMAEPEPQRQEAVRKIAEQESTLPFDLSERPPVRARLLRLEHNDHVLLFTMHHIISDGWSVGIMIRELTLLYEARLKGVQPQLPPLEIQYADFAVWQRNWLQHEALEEQLSYWRKQLEGVEPLTVQPDFPRPTHVSNRGAVLSFHLGAEITARLKDLSRREDVTLFMTLLAAFQVLMARYTGQRDVVVGSPIAGRNRLETEGLIGFFVNVLAMRANLEPNPGFRALLAQTKNTVLDAYAHQDLPFEKLMEELRPERDMGGPSFVRVTFLLQNVPIEELRLGELRVSSFQPTSQTTVKFEISLNVTETGAGMRANLEYETDLFHPEKMQALLGHWRTILESVVAEPERPVLEIPLLSSIEKRQILEDWNSRKLEADAEIAPEHLFAHHAARNPEGLAVSFQGKSWSYRELEQRANQLARYLQAMGAEPEVGVGCCFDRSLDLVLGPLAVLKAGGTYVPIDTLYPAERIGYVLRNANVKILLTHASMQERLPDYEGHIVYLDSGWEEIATQSAEPPASRAFPENAAYIIHTSGSTGLPKGVVVERHELVYFLHSINSMYGISPADKVLLIASAVFDVSLGQLFLALCFGAQLEILPDFRSEGVDPIAYMVATGATVAEFSPALLVAFQRSWPQLSGSATRLIILSGESIPAEAVEQWRQTVPERIDVVNAYGPTEAVIECTEHYFPPASSQPVDVLIGRPLPKRRLYVLDEHMEPVPVGVNGELLIGGAGLARGYSGRPDLTAERFLPDPYGKPGSRMYRTGDLALWRNNGRLKFNGRADHQVKIRGYRIELGEIEAVLGQHAGVREAAVIIHQGPQAGEKQLVACLSGDTSLPSQINELRAHLRSKLPEYMVPFAFIFLEKLPVNANGKVDRRALAKLQPELGALPIDSMPREKTPMEEMLCGIFEDVLSCGPVSVADNFFNLGGHSLLGTQVMARIGDLLGVEVPLRRLFEASSVEELAKSVEQLSAEGRTRKAPSLARAVRSGALPLSFAQQRLWFLDQLEPGSAAYNIPLWINLKGPLDTEALHWSLQEIIRRHEALRTSFGMKDGTPIQEVMTETDPEIEEADLHEEEREQREEQAIRLARGAALRGFDLSRGPLLRVKLLGVGAEEHMLVITMHHIVSDGWSIGVLVHELAELYGARVKGEKAKLKE
ncbi:MAG: amino acid adenylation domain-containing protein, partial [Acidobacteriia bacterium]|nr:amino acid adenylation domain-containing protein [Terriglobia bacterium]